MSFWSKIGDFFTGGGGDHSAASGAMNRAQAAAAAGMTDDQYKQWAYAVTHPEEARAKGLAVPGLHDNFLSNSGAVQTAVGALDKPVSGALSALAYLPNKFDQGVSSASLHWDQSLSWSDAWKATQSGGVDVNGQHLANVNIGSLAYNAIVRQPFGLNNTHKFATDTSAIQQYNSDQNTWTGRIGSGAIDVAATWYADPTLIAGKATKISRFASRLPDEQAATAAVNAATSINSGERAARGALNPSGLFSKGSEESGQRLFQFVKTLDNGGNVAGRQVLLNRTPETAPVLGLLDQADKIEDLDLQRQVKIDILGAAAGSPVSRTRLIESAPELARAQMRASLAPEGREQLDLLHSAFAGADSADPQMVTEIGNAFVDAATQFGTLENQAEIAALHAKHLKSIHDSFDRLDAVAAQAPLEQAGLTALDRAKAALRNHVAQDFHYQDGPSSRTVRVLHWATNQRFRGTIATDHAIRGNQELMDWMTRAKIKDPNTGKTVSLFSGEERQAASTAFLTAKTQEQRRRQVDNLWTTMYGKVASYHEGMDAAQVKALANKGKTVRQGAVRYATAELERARLAGDDIVTLDDPALGTPTRIKASLLETHIANNVVLPDPMEIQKAVRQELEAPSTFDDVTARARQFSNGLDHFNNVWRLAVLGRPGLLVRTQVDSQGRALAVMGGTAYVHSALTGLGHTIGQRVLRQDELIQVDAKASDLALADDLRSQAAALRSTADRNDRVASLRRGVTPDDAVLPPTLDERGAVIRGEGKQTTQPLSADALANSSPAALRARADALEAQATTLENRKYETTKFRQGAQDETLNLGKGRKVTTRLADSGQDVRDLGSAAYKGGKPSEAMTQVPPRNMAEVLDRANSRQLKRLYEDRGKWVTYAPTDPHWAAGWIRTMDQLRNSYTGRKILDLGDTATPDLVNALRRDSRVRQEWSEVRADNEDFDGWLARLVNTVAWNAPSTEIREALRTRGHMSPNDVDRLFAENKVDKMYVQGPEFSMRPPKGSKPDSLVRRFVAKMSDTPDLIAARHPVMVERYRKHIMELAGRQFAQHPEWTELPASMQAKIEKIAKHRAVMDTQQTFYDTAKFTGAHNSLRYISPFVGAWEDAIVSWSSLFYDNPATAGAFNKIWNAPNRMGLVVDQNGDAIRPGQQTDQSFLVLPMEFNNNFKQSKKMTIRKDSLNSIFQGAQWYTPGVGPVIQIPVQELVAKIHPEIGDSNNPIVRTFLPFGTPKTATGGGFLSNLAADIANNTAPAWARAVYSMWNPNDPNNAEAYLASINQQIIDARENGKPIPSASDLDKKAAAAARSAGFIRAVSLFGLGVSGQQSTVADFYKRQYDLLQSQADELHKKGTTPSAEFVKQFPEAAGLQWSLSKSQTGVNATMVAWKAEKNYAKEIKANPAYGWFYVGADNLDPNADFSQSVYNAQSSRMLGISGSGVERQRQSRSQLIDSTLAEDGWRTYNGLQTAIQQALQAQGLTSLNQAAAAPILAAKRAAVSALRAQNPAWAKDFDTGQDSGKLQRFIDSIATPALSNPDLKDRSDIQALGQYLQMRQMALQVLAQRGLKSLNSAAAAPMAAALDAAGQQLANQNLGFQQMWNRVLSSEVESASQKVA